MTRPIRPKNVPIKAAKDTKFGRSETGGEPARQDHLSESVGGPCPRKSASKTEIAEQIGLQLRSIYDDVLAQPVPGRFLDLLQQLENASRTGHSKDRM